MSKAIAKLTIKMMSADDVHVTQSGEDAEALFMAATAVATIILNSSNGSRTKADVFARTAKVVIDGLINDAFEQNDFAAAHYDPDAPAEKQDDHAAARPGDVDSMMEKIIADAMKQAKENPGQAQGVTFKVPAGDMPMEEVVKHIISAVDKQARKDQNGG